LIKWDRPPGGEPFLYVLSDAVLEVRMSTAG